MGLLKALTFFALVLTTTYSHATLLSEDQYITVHHTDTNTYLDWTWASSLNVQTHSAGGVKDNVLFDPETVGEGWRSAEDDEFTFFKNNITAEDFKIGHATYKNSFTHFNWDPILEISNTKLEVNPDVFNPLNKTISATFTEGSSMDSVFSSYDAGAYDTFFVRFSTPQDSTPVPEPFSLILFATALMLLSQRWNKKVN